MVQMIDDEVEKAREHEEWRVEYMTSYLRDMDIREEGIEIGLEQGLKQGREEGREEGLSALVCSLKNFITDKEALYQAVIKNEAYKDTPREEVLKYLK